MRRRAEVLGGTERARRSTRTRSAWRCRPRTIRIDYAIVRGRHPARAVRRGRGDRLGLRRVFAPTKVGTGSTTAPRPSASVREGLAKGKLSLLLRGEKLKGSFALVRTKEQKNWLLIKHKDRFVGEGRRHRAGPLGPVRRGGRGDEESLPAHRMPASSAWCPTGRARRDAGKTLAPMLAELGEAPFNDADWMWEPKLDGYRVLAFIDAQRRAAALAARARARRGLSGARRASSASRSVDAMILDGELVAFDASGKPSFNALQNRVQLKTEREIAAADRRRRSCSSASTCCHFAGIDLRKRRLSRSAPLSRAVPAAVAARAARARAGRRRGPARRRRSRAASKA